MFKKLVSLFEKKNPILQLNEAGDKGVKIIRIWEKNGSTILNSLPIEPDPNFCLEGVHLFYARDAKAFDLSKTISLISEYYKKLLSSHTKYLKFSADITDHLKNNMYFSISCTQGFSDNSYSSESLIIIRTSECEFKGCIDRRDNAYYFE